jgi:phosphoserine phosphatase
MTSAAPLPKSLRLAAALPAPFVLSDYEPFKPLGNGTFGIAGLGDITERAMRDLRTALSKAYAKDATVGYCAAPRIRAVFFDMDATVIVQESLVELAAFVGKAEEVARVTERAMAGEIDFKAALAERVALLAGLPESVLAEVSERLTLTRGLQPFIGFCREIGVKTYMATGGFTQLAVPIMRKVGFDGVRANVLEVVDGKLTGKTTGPIVDAAGKRAFLLETCAALGFDPKEVAAVGDGANDIPMMEAAGCGIGFQPKDVLVPHVHAVNRIGHHGFLAPLLFGRDLGITRARLGT